ncbi:MAG: Smr/MutS family protein [bacterium]
MPEIKTVPENDERPGRNTAPEITRFETPPPGAEDAEPAATMEALMAGEEFDPSLKFAGAVTPPPRRRGETRRRFSDDVEPDEELDLHGKTQEEAIRMVQNFLLVSHRQKLRHVLIITGKGKKSGQEGPVLGRAVFHWLERNGARYVRDFIQAPPRMGGAGAIWITLR